MENYPVPAASTKDIYTYYAGWITWLFFPSLATVVNLISVVFHRLLRHPEIMKEIINEQNQVFGNHYSDDNSKDCFTIVSVRKLVKLDSVCRESFRTNKEFNVSERANVGRESVILSNGVVIPPGEFYVLFNLWINHQDSILQKDTIGSYEKFEPFRHLETSQSVTKTGDDFLLFGLGKHVCP
ncbi:cytochrome P450 [Phascolomyces articulosus]|uniref:Cytochrome P450 n=1 Tax=Phascolomyces articulosus TaxID=60185 RepID=A0AAD5P9C1_9FUNG|nr:cytochrome P450 [Phascolomyces articulosus]